MSKLYYLICLHLLRPVVSAPSWPGAVVASTEVAAMSLRRVPPARLVGAMGSE